jgi:hypothetical protein
MERHPNRENPIGLYLRDHLGTDKVRISENPSTLVMLFCIDDERGRLQHRLKVRQEVIADHDVEELENILDAQRVIERMREAGTESVVVSTDDGSGDTGNSANCNNVANDPTDVGAYSLSGSPYGTFDQGGNVWEWNEVIIGSNRGWRGGSFGSAPDALAASFRSSTGIPVREGNPIGFRVAMIPEPGTGVLFAFGLMALAAGRRRL